MTVKRGREQHPGGSADPARSGAGVMVVGFGTHALTIVRHTDKHKRVILRRIPADLLRFRPRGGPRRSRAAQVADWGGDHSSPSGRRKSPRCGAPPTWPTSGAGTVLPNPVVGCVLLASGGWTVGEGYHERAGGPHAEVAAIAAAGEWARGATAVVTLEPCNHTGRTGPCTEALMAAGVVRVVVAVRDPWHTASGGIERLRQAGHRGRRGGARRDRGGRPRPSRPPRTSTGSG